MRRLACQDSLAFGLKDVSLPAWASLKPQVLGAGGCPWGTCQEWRERDIWGYSERLFTHTHPRIPDGIEPQLSQW